MKIPDPHVPPSIHIVLNLKNNIPSTSSTPPLDSQSSTPALIFRQPSISPILIKNTHVERAKRLSKNSETKKSIHKAAKFVQKSAGHLANIALEIEKKLGVMEIDLVIANLALNKIFDAIAKQNTPEAEAIALVLDIIKDSIINAQNELKQTAADNARFIIIESLIARIAGLIAQATADITLDYFAPPLKKFVF